MPARTCQVPSQASGSLAPTPCSAYSCSVAAPREIHGLTPRRSEAHIDTHCRDPLPGVGLCGLAALLHFPGPAQSRHLFCHANKADARAAAVCRTAGQSKDIAWGGLGRPSKKDETLTMSGKHQSAAYCRGEKGRNARTAPCRIPIIKVMPSAPQVTSDVPHDNRR